MVEFDNTNRGVLFHEQNKKSDNHPDLTGKLNVEGKEYRIAAWNKQGKNGEFYSLAISEPKPPEQTGYQKAKATAESLKQTEVDEIGDEPINLNDIPF